jgi:hypothetical protein
MPRATSFQFSFNAGEWSKSVSGRIDLTKRRQALELSTNVVPLLQGTAVRRPGTYYVAAAKTSSANIRLKRFEFSTTQAYILEFGENYIRFYTNRGQLLDGGSPYEVTTTYSGDELAALGFTQSADVLYITHPNHAPAKLERLGATDWTLTDIAFQDGPYLPQNISGTYISSNKAWEGATGATLTANNADGINGGLGFQATDVGRLFRIATQNTADDGTITYTWSWGIITAVADSTHATWDVLGITPV